MRSESNTRAEIVELIGKVEAGFEDLPYAKYRAEFDERAETILTALESSGRAVVPREPTPAMLASVRWDDDDTREGWECMLAAALPPSKE